MHSRTRTKRLKIDIACGECRKRKVRCNGARPSCSNCQSRPRGQRTCVYAGAAAESSPPPTNPNTTPSASKQPNSHRPLVQREQAPESPGHLTLTPRHATVAPRLLSAATEHVPIVQNVVPENSGRGLEVPADQPSLFRSAQSHESLADRANLDLAPMVNAPLFGLVSKTGVMDKGPLAAAFSEAPALPPRRHADHFMDLYWRYLNPLIPVLDEEFTTRQYRALYEGTPLTEVDEGVFIAILNVVFALSTQLQEHVPTAQREQASSTFFHRAWDLIHPETIIWTPGSLEAVQCLLLICQYLQCTNKPHQTWMAVGIAVRLAQSLKLYVPTGVNTSVDGKRERMRIRVWQSCVYLDRQISASYARPPIVSQRMWAAISDSSNRVPNASFDDQYFAKSLEALDIIQPLLSWNPGLKTLGGFEVGSGFPESLSMHEQCIRAAQLERDLAEWERNLPRWLVLGSEDSQLNHGTQSQAVILRLRYLHGRIILLRPILTQLCLSKPPYDLSTEPRLTESLIRDCCHSCIDDAAEVISVVSTHSQPRTGGTLPAIPWWTRLFYLYVASTVIITALRPIDTFRTAKVMESWEGIISTLRAHESLSHHVQHLIEMLISISMMSRDPGHLRPTVGDEGTSGISQNPMLPHDTFGLDNLDYGWDETFWMEAITPWK